MSAQLRTPAPARPQQRGGRKNFVRTTPGGGRADGRRPGRNTGPPAVVGHRDGRSRGAAEPTGPGVRAAGAGYFLPAGLASAESEESAAMKASWGTSTRPTIFIRFLPSFCFSSSLRLRLMSPP